MMKNLNIILVLKEEDRGHLDNSFIVGEETMKVMDKKCFQVKTWYKRRMKMMETWRVERH